MKFKNSAGILKSIRCRLNLKQEELGEMIGCSGQFISNAERGNCALPSHCMVKLIKILKKNKMAADVPVVIERYASDLHEHALEKARSWLK